MSHDDGILSFSPIFSSLAYSEKLYIFPWPFDPVN